MELPAHDSIKALYWGAGYTLQEVADALNLSTDEVREVMLDTNIYIRDESIERNTYKRTHKHANHMVLLQMLNDGMTVEQIAADSGIQSVTVTKWMKQFNINIPDEYDGEVWDEVGEDESSSDRMSSTNSEDDGPTYDITIDKPLGGTSSGHEGGGQGPESGLHGDTPWKDEDTLRRLYVEEGLSQKEIGNELGCAQPTILRWLRKHNIPTRSVGSGKPKDSPWKDEDTLRRLYVEKGLSTVEIADELGCSDVTILRWLHKFGIPTRPTAPETNPVVEIDEHILKTMYIVNDMTAKEIADIFECHRSTVEKRLSEYGIRKQEPDKNPARNFEKKLEPRRFLLKGHDGVWRTPREHLANLQRR